MKERIFFDTDIVLDLIQERPGYLSAAKILQMQEDGLLSVCISSLSVANIAYVLRKTFGDLMVAPTLKQIVSMMTVLDMTESQISDAILYDGPDFEDILQAVCAGKNACTAIITHNPRDFKIRKGLQDGDRFPPVFTPEEFCARAVNDV